MSQRTHRSKIGSAVACVLSIAAMNKVFAADSATQLDEVTVTATRIAAVTYDVPASISSVSGDIFKNSSLAVNLADDVSQVPGLLARNRNNYAQDQQVSIRGYGANSAFGIRGVRVYQDGIPASSPDGQGQVSQFNLETASRVEVLRGPFSSLYGNSSGGVIQIFTADGREPGEIRGGLVGGSFGTFRASVAASDDLGAFSYNAGFSHFQIDGFRDHSEAENESFNAKLGYEINDKNKLTFVGNLISRPDAQDPLGLTPAQFAADPEQTAVEAINFNTRKSTEQAQGGLIYDWQATETQSVRLMGYYGQRKVEQFLAIPSTAQVAQTSAGGVIDLDREYAGADARWTWQGMLADKAFSIVAGVSYDRQNERRKGFNNFIGTTFGVKGPLKRDENNITTGTDEFVQASWDFAEQWSLMVGVRHSEVDFDSQDHYIVGTNPDDSGTKSYSDTLPVGGLMYKALPWLHVYASYGEGFQTPIVAELAYRASGGTGLNLDLRPARSENAELGAKIQSGDLSGEIAFFQARTEDEIVINTNTGGRSTYQNSGRTKRQGVELSLAYRIADTWRAQFAYTYLDATYTDAYRTCTAAPCPTPTTLVPAGNRLPGIPENNLFASLRWGGDLGFHASANVQYVGDVAVNDVNSVFAPSYTIAGIEGGYGMDFNQWRLNAFVRVNNAFDEDYVGSIIVNDGNQRYFEPGPPVAVLAGVNISWK